MSLFVVLKADRWCGIEQIVWYEKWDGQEIA